MIKVDKGDVPEFLNSVEVRIAFEDLKSFYSQKDRVDIPHKLTPIRLRKLTP